MNFTTIFIIIAIGIFINFTFAKTFQEKEAETLETIATDFENLSLKKSELFVKLTLEIEKIRDQEAKSRQRRGGLCGKKVYIRALELCGELEEIGNDVDISSKCCHTSCTDEFIKTTLCPSKSEQKTTSQVQ